MEHFKCLLLLRSNYAEGGNKFNDIIKIKLNGSLHLRRLYPPSIPRRPGAVLDNSLRSEDSKGGEEILGLREDKRDGIHQ